METQGFCRYCGQIRMVEADDEAKANMKATSLCDCSEGKAARDAQQQAESARINIHILFKDEEPWVEKILTAGIEDMQAAKLKKLTIKTFDGVTAEMKISGNGIISVERKETVTDHLEG